VDPTWRERLVHMRRVVTHVEGVLIDGAVYVLEAAHYTTPRRGGEGAVREVCDLFRPAQDRCPS
jgi:3-deoxy-D-manno-octulosonate 8-phosphate phosphatase KdsC-like HAD superfamily phosphatase